MPTEPTSPEAPFPTSLEPPETNTEKHLPPDGGVVPCERSISETFRHRGWRHNRRLIYDALCRVCRSDARVIAFSDCGFNAWVYRTYGEPAEYRLGGSACHDRFCLPCARARGRILADNIVKTLAGKPVRFITLTLRQRPEPLVHVINRLHTAFTKLRTRPIWKDNVLGGCAILEIKWSDVNEAWNVHLHCLVHGKYILQSTLSAIWSAVTGDSFVVDIRLITSSVHIATYIAKYVSKPFDNTYVNRPARLDEAIMAMHGRRLCMTFGTWRGIRLTETPSDGEWESLGSFDTLAYLASTGDASALKAIRYICQDDAPAVIRRAAESRSPPVTTKPTDNQTFLDWPACSTF